MPVKAGPNVRETINQMKIRIAGTGTGQYVRCSRRELTLRIGPTSHNDNNTGQTAIVTQL